jgi:predicted RNA-binding protein with PIN domain
MGEPLLIVDGHSVIFAWDDLRALHARNPETARDALVRRLVPVHDAVRRTAVVFDGRGGRTTEQAHSTGIKVFYAGGRQSADNVVERLAARLGSEHDLLVVTDDRMEQQTITTFGASWISTAELRDLIDRAERGVRETIRKRAREDPRG